MKRIALWLIFATVTLAAFSSSTLADSDHPLWVTPYGDGFYNYDLDIQGDPTCCGDNPIATIWSYWANKSAVKEYLRSRAGPGYPGTGGVKWEYVYDQSTLWNGDAGRQTACYCQGGNGYRRHMRIYAPYDDNLYNTSWGDYVIASQHYDINHAGCDRTDCGYSTPGAEKFGYSENVEDIILQEASSDGYWTNPNWYNAQNYGYYWEDSKHYHQSDGYAATIVFW